MLYFCDISKIQRLFRNQNISADSVEIFSKSFIEQKLAKLEIIAKIGVVWTN